MDKYYAMAAEYFHTFEGKQFYPQLLSKPWICWFITGTAFVTSIGGSLWFRSWLWVGLMYLFEVLFLICVFWIEKLQWEKQKKHFGLRTGGPKAHLDGIKLLHLKRITHKTADNFAAMVKEIADLKAARTRFSPPSINIDRLIYDPDSKARLIAITLSSIALFGALLVNTTEIPLVSLLEFMADDRFGSYLIKLAVLAAGLYFILVGLYFGFTQVKSFTGTWLARWKWKAADDFVLQYFVSALIAQYDPLGKK